MTKWDVGETNPDVSLSSKRFPAPKSTTCDFEGWWFPHYRSPTCRLLLQTMAHRQVQWIALWKDSSHNERSTQTSSRVDISAYQSDLKHIIKNTCQLYIAKEQVTGKEHMPFPHIQWVRTAVVLQDQIQPEWKVHGRSRWKHRTLHGNIIFLKCMHHHVQAKSSIQTNPSKQDTQMAEEAFSSTAVSAAIAKTFSDNCGCRQP